mgnify:CR=1 FL=1
MPNKKYLNLSLLIVCGYVFSAGSLPAQYESKQEKQGLENTDESSNKEKPIEVKNKLCPVDFKKITPENKYPYAYKDKLYYFHSPKCIEEFEKDPQGFLKAWEKKERFYKINIIYD